MAGLRGWWVMAAALPSLQAMRGVRAASPALCSPWLWLAGAVARRLTAQYPHAGTTQLLWYHVGPLAGAGVGLWLPAVGRGGHDVVSGGGVLLLVKPCSPSGSQPAKAESLGDPDSATALTA